MIFRIAWFVFACLAFCLHDAQAQESDVMRELDWRVKEAADHLREVRRGVEEEKLELRQRRLEWELEAVQNDEEIPRPEARRLRAELLETSERKLSLRLRGAENRFNLATAMRNVRKFEEAMQAVNLARARLHQAGLPQQARTLDPVARNLEEQLKNAALRLQYFQAQADGNEAVVEELGRRLHLEPEQPHHPPRDEGAAEKKKAF